MEKGLERHKGEHKATAGFQGDRKGRPYPHHRSFQGDRKGRPCPRSVKVHVTEEM